jgi:hypothetical protein
VSQELAAEEQRLRVEREQEVESAKIQVVNAEKDIKVVKAKTEKVRLGQYCVLQCSVRY